jgi:FtsH-binding integral membrane protein
LSLYGYTTKRDLTGMGSFLFMGLIGLIIAMVVNIFLASSALQFASRWSACWCSRASPPTTRRRSRRCTSPRRRQRDGQARRIMGALTLYLDFINLFMFLLFLGNRE